MSKWYLLVSVVALTGCASGSFFEKRDLNSSGQQGGLTLSCSGFKTWDDCYRAAVNTCPKGYETISKEENIITQARTLRINCK